MRQVGMHRSGVALPRPAPGIRQLAPKGLGTAPSGGQRWHPHGAQASIAVVVGLIPRSASPWNPEAFSSSCGQSDHETNPSALFLFPAPPPHTALVCLSLSAPHTFSLLRLAAHILVTPAHSFSFPTRHHLHRFFCPLNLSLSGDAVT